MPNPPARELLQTFADHLSAVEGLSPKTVTSYTSDLENFAAHTPAFEKAEEGEIEEYLASLLEFSPRTQARKLVALKRFFSWLLREGRRSDDPTALLESPKMPKRLPKALSQADVAKILEALSENTHESRLQRALLTGLYAAGLRISELVHLKIGDLSAGEGRVLRVQGKGDKTREVPLGEAACEVLGDYARHTRPVFNKSNSEWLFPGKGTGPMSRQQAWLHIKKAGQKAGVSLHPHMLRHSFATHLLENDADLRSVQAMLGHASLTTTEIYTKIADSRLNTALQAFHPLNRKKSRS